MSNCTSKDSPFIKGVKFNLNQYQKSDTELKEMKIVPYSSAVGSLIYVVI